MKKAIDIVTMVIDKRTQFVNKQREAEEKSAESYVNEFKNWDATVFKTLNEIVYGIIKGKMERIAKAYKGDARTYFISILKNCVTFSFEISTKEIEDGFRLKEFYFQRCITWKQLFRPLPKDSVMDKSILSVCDTICKLQNPANELKWYTLGITQEALTKHSLDRLNDGVTEFFTSNDGSNCSVEFELLPIRDGLPSENMKDFKFDCKVRMYLKEELPTNVQFIFNP